MFSCGSRPSQQEEVECERRTECIYEVEWIHEHDGYVDGRVIIELNSKNAEIIDRMSNKV